MFEGLLMFVWMAARW